MGGSVTYVWRDGSRLTPWMFYIIGLINAEMVRLFGVSLLVSSGIRTYEEQKAIFLARYVRAANINGRRVYDTRWWNGVLWYRISSAGTVAQPGTSNHEIQGTRAAVDIRDTGNDAGVTVRTSTRGKWIRANASRWGLVASGDGFGEGWHFDILNIFNTPPTTPTPPTPSQEMITMATEVIVTFKDNNNKPLPDSKRRAAFVNTDSGFYTDFSWMTIADANLWAKQVGMPAGALQFSDSGYDKFLSKLAAIS